MNAELSLLIIFELQLFSRSQLLDLAQIVHIYMQEKP